MKKYLLFLSAILLFSTGIWIVRHLFFTTTPPAVRAIVIPAGIPAGIIADTLAKYNIVSSAELFRLLARIQRADGHFRPGIYRFPPGMHMHEVIASLVAGAHRIPRMVTIPEGSTLKGIASILRRECGMDSISVTSLAGDASFIRSLGLRARSLEGFLLPNTYDASDSPTEEEFLRRMFAAWKTVVPPLLRKRPASDRRNESEILILASLVEGEARLDGERARIAGVYSNRLSRGMRLQADPTIQYIIGDGPRRLFYRDLEIDSPYNTYLYGGLPPGPVNNPGLKSIAAALRPERHSYLYFVADGSGGHRFSRTETEHARAVERYRLTRDRQGATLHE